MRHLLSLLGDLFGWPGGILLSNLVWLPVQYSALAVKLASHRKAVHSRLDDQDVTLAAIAEHLGISLHPEDGTP